MEMEDLEWDEAKRELVLKERGIDFADAVSVFSNVHITAWDNRADYGEQRFNTMGLLAERIVVVISHTPRGRKTRIITMRKANERERERFWERLDQA